jgi:DNA-binding transcriptional ArsR family regulator
MSYLCGEEFVEERRILLPSHKTTKTDQKTREEEPYYIAKIPVSWITKADEAGALKLGLALWFFVGVTGSRTIRFTKRLRDAFQLDRSTVYRGLKVLEDAKLVKVTSNQGSPTIVTVLDGPTADDDQERKIRTAFLEARSKSC